MPTSSDLLRPLTEALSLESLLEKRLQEGMVVTSLQELLLGATHDDVVQSSSENSSSSKKLTTRQAIRIVVGVLDDAVQVWTNLFLDQDLPQRQNAFDAVCGPNARQLVGLLALGPRRLPPGVVSALCSTIVQLVRVSSVGPLCLVAGSLVLELVDTAKDAFHCCNPSEHGATATVATHRQYTRPLLIAAQNILRRTGRQLFADINYLPSGLMSMITASLEQLVVLVEVTQRNIANGQGQGVIKGGSSLGHHHREIPLMRSGLDEMSYETFRLTIYMLDHMAFCPGSVGSDFLGLSRKLVVADEYMLGPKSSTSHQRPGHQGMIAAPRFGLLDALSREVLAAFVRRLDGKKNTTASISSPRSKQQQQQQDSSPLSGKVNAPGGSEKVQAATVASTTSAPRSAVVKQLETTKFSKEELLRFMEAREAVYLEERELLEAQLRAEETKAALLDEYHAKQIQEVGALTHVAVGGKEDGGAGAQVIALLEREHTLNQMILTSSTEHRDTKATLHAKITAEQQVAQAESNVAARLAAE